MGRRCWVESSGKNEHKQKGSGIRIRIYQFEYLRWLNLNVDRKNAWHWRALGTCE